MTYVTVSGKLEHFATIKELRVFFGSREQPAPLREVIDMLTSMSPQEKKALRSNPEIPHLDYWDDLDADERVFQDG